MRCYHIGLFGSRRLLNKDNAWQDTRRRMERTNPDLRTMAVSRLCTRKPLDVLITLTTVVGDAPATKEG